MDRRSTASGHRHHTTQMVNHKSLLRYGALLGILSTALLAHAADRTIWKIGEFNASSGEFRSQDINYSDPKSDPVYVIGKSKSSDWYRFQPGPANGTTGGRLHPFTIKFNLPSVPRGVYHLRVAMLYETPRLSFLKLDVNGHSGFFYFHPKLDFQAGDWEGTFVPQTSADDKTISIPASFLHQGDNQFVLTAMDDPSTVQNSLGGIAPGHTGLIYDALEFSQDEAATYDTNAFSARIEPTIFYKNANSGVAEIVDVFLSSASLPISGEASLEISDHTYSRSFTTENDFGEQRLTFEVPEWQGSMDARVHRQGQSSVAKIEPAKKWTVAIIPHEHLDVGFTDYAAKVSELHSQSIDAAMDLIRKTPDFRWTLDGSWVADQYLKGRSAEASKEFLDHVRAGSIVIPPEIANQHTGNASFEGLARSFYDEHELAAKYHLPPAEAGQTVDVPAYTWGYASVLHDAGIKYFIGASNSWRAPVMLLGRWNEKSPFYWEGPDGGRLLMWYSRAYLQMHTLFAGPWRMEAVRDALPVFLQAYTRPDYTANTAIIFGTQLENTPLAKEQSEIVSTFNHQYAWPKLEFATVDSALSQIEREWKGTIPTYRGDFGPYWEDGYGSDAAHTAIHRENQHRILTAEIVGAAASSLDPRVRPDKSMLDDAWQNELIYDEHTWTYVSATTQPEHHQSTEQIALKGSRVERARNDISESIQRGWAQLEALVKPKENSVAVFNALSWPRSGIVETDLPEGSTLVDATGKAVPLEIVFKGIGIPLPGFGPGNIRVRFLAADVPAVGYKLFTIKPAPAKPAKDEVRSNIFENRYYRITLDAAGGAISSIFDKELNHEVVDRASPFKFGQYLYVTGGDDYPNNSLYRFGAGLNPPKLTPNPASGGKLVSAIKTPLGISITLTSTSINTPAITTEIFLSDSAKQIVLTYKLHKNRVLTRESAYIAFPLAVANPEFGYGSQSAWINPAKDELPGGSREWYLPTTWAAAHNAQLTAAIVPLDAPLVNFGDIVRANWPATFAPKSSTVFSWLMNNYWGTNFPAWQGGDFTFRYVITTGPAFDPAALTRLAEDALTPLERDDVLGSNDPSQLPQDQASLLEISDSNISLLTWKRAEDGNGTIVRLQEIAGKPTTFTLRSRYLAIEHAWLCNLLEDNQAEMAAHGDTLSVSIKPYRVLTIRLQTGSHLAQASAP